jgi:hypothetical protein
LAVDSSDSLHVVWHGDTTGSSEVFYRRSDDAGETWSASKRLTWTSGISTHPDIAIDSSDSIHLVWEDQTPGNSEIYYRNSTDGGENWNMVKRLTWTSDDTSNPALAASSSGIVYAVWDDPIPGNGEIYGKRSTDGGETWSSVRRLTWTSGSSYDPDIAVSPPDSIHLVWAAEVPGDTEVFYQGSTDSGETWRPTRQLTWNTGSSGSVSAAVDSIHAVHIVFMDATPGDLEIHYRKSADGGVNWDPVQRLTWTSGNSYFPVIATDSANVAHIVWRDDISGNIEVYYKNGN